MREDHTLAEIAGLSAGYRYSAESRRQREWNGRSEMNTQLPGLIALTPLVPPPFRLMTNRSELSLIVANCHFFIAVHQHCAGPRSTACS